MFDLWPKTLLWSGIIFEKITNRSRNWRLYWFKLLYDSKGFSDKSSRSIKKINLNIFHFNQRNSDIICWLEFLAQFSPISVLKLFSVQMASFNDQLQLFHWLAECGYFKHMSLKVVWWSEICYESLKIFSSGRWFLEFKRLTNRESLIRLPRSA